MRLRDAAVLVAVLAVLGVTYGHLLPPFDFLTFFHAGRHLLHGRSPYALPSSAVFRSGHAFVYPLFVGWLFAPLAGLPLGPAEIVYFAGSVAAIVASCQLLGRRDLMAPALVLACSTTIVGVQMGTLNAFLLLGLASSWHWRESRPLTSGVILGVTAAAKLFLLPTLLWPVLRRRYGQAVAAAVTALAVVVGGVAAGPLSLTGYLHMMSRLEAREQAASWSLSSFLHGLGATRSVSSAGAVIVAAGCVAAVARRRARLGDGQVLAAVVLCSLLASPIVWGSYLLLVTVPLLVVGRANRLLGAFVLATWALLTPDAAPATRVAVGVAVAVALVLISLRPFRGRGPRVVAGGRSAVRPAYVVAGAGFVALMFTLPGPARSALPALATMGVVAAATLLAPQVTRREAVTGVERGRPQPDPVGRPEVGDHQPPLDQRVRPPRS